MKIGITNFLYQFCVKFTTLNEYIERGCRYIHGDKIDVYIDAASICRSIFENSQNLIIEDATDVAAGILNTSIHYRDFFNRMGVSSRIFIIASYDGVYPTSKSTCPEYNEGYIKKVAYNPDLAEHIRNNLALIETLCKGLLGIYYVDSTGFESNAVIYHLMDKNMQIDNGIVSLIISKDILCSDVVYSKNYMNKSIMIYPRKSKGEDVSILLGENQEFHHNGYQGLYKPISPFLSIYKSKMDATQHDRVLLSTCIIPLISMSGFEKKSLKCLINVSKSLNILSGIISSIGTLGFNNIQAYEFERLLREQNQISSDIVNLIINRYNAIDSKVQSHHYALSVPAMKEYMIDLYDPKSIQDINTKYFNKHPIDIAKV